MKWKIILVIRSNFIHMFTQTGIWVKIKKLTDIQEFCFEEYLKTINDFWENSTILDRN
jgi:hypothetical protein